MKLSTTPSTTKPKIPPVSPTKAQQGGEPYQLTKADGTGIFYPCFVPASSPLKGRKDEIGNFMKNPFILLIVLFLAVILSMRWSEAENRRCCTDPDYIPASVQITEAVKVWWGE